MNEGGGFCSQISKLNIKQFIIKQCSTHSFFLSTQKRERIKKKSNPNVANDTGDINKS